MSRPAEDDVVAVTVFGGVAGSAAVGLGSRLRDFLVHDAVEVLLGVEMIVTVENDGDAVLLEQLMDRGRPAGTVLPEAITAIRVLATPLKERRGFCPAAGLIICAADVPLGTLPILFGTQIAPA